MYQHIGRIHYAGITIAATKGIISCWASAYKKSGENDLYLIAISCVSISRN